MHKITTLWGLLCLLCCAICFSYQQSLQAGLILAAILDKGSVSQKVCAWSGLCQCSCEADALTARFNGQPDSDGPATRHTGLAFANKDSGGTAIKKNLEVKPLFKTSDILEFKWTECKKGQYTCR
jgi:hypothetical protein